MLLHFPDGQSFATGVTGYTSRSLRTTDSDDNDPPPENRLFIQVELPGKSGKALMTEVAVDTGSSYFFCNAPIANRLNLDDLEHIGPHTTSLRGEPVPGELYRLNLKLMAEEGHSAEVEVTALIPNDRTEERWMKYVPCLLGWHGCLERIRFAVDPAHDAEKFYFGVYS